MNFYKCIDNKSFNKDDVEKNLQIPLNFVRRNHFA